MQARIHQEAQVSGGGGYSYASSVRGPLSFASYTLANPPKFVSNVIEFVYAPTRAGDDTPLIKTRKVVWTVQLCLGGVLNAIFFGYALNSNDWWSVGAGIFGVCAAALLVIYLAITKRMTQSFTVFAVVISCIDMSLVDLGTLSAMHPRLWPLFITVVDILLALRCPDWMTHVVVLWVVLHLVVTHCERWLRFGLLDLPPMLSYGRRAAVCACARPPCAVPLENMLSDLLTHLFVFLMDYVITRHFARNLFSEENKVAAATGAAQQVSACLARFDLDDAEAVLARRSPELPPELLGSLQVLLGNLRRYRPFLPDALFERPEAAAGARSGGGGGGSSPGARLSPVQQQRAMLAASMMAAASSTPPGAAQGCACIVFTDIVGSTALWAHDAPCMLRAMETHNATVRATLEALRGYEVKTIGDSFMAAFARLDDGVRFGLRTQADLLAARWCPTLLRQKGCQPDARGLWGGVTVRIGVNVGAVTIETNPVTGRADYFGPTVNLAARLEAAAPHGAVAVEAARVAELSEGVRRALAEGPVRRQRVKGLENPLCVAALYPTALAARANDVRRMGGSDDGARSTGGSSAATSENPHLSPAVLGGPRAAAATVATVSFASAWNAETNLTWQQGMRALVGLVDRFQGKVFGVVGTAAHVAWNAPQACQTHVDNGYGFALRAAGLGGGGGGGGGDLCAGEAEPMSVVFAVSLCTGRVVHGALGGAHQRFLNVSGECVELSRRLTELALHWGGGEGGDGGGGDGGEQQLPFLFANLLERKYVPHYIWEQVVGVPQWKGCEHTQLRRHDVWCVRRAETVEMLEEQLQQTKQPEGPDARGGGAGGGRKGGGGDTSGAAPLRVPGSDASSESVDDE